MRQAANDQRLVEGGARRNPHALVVQKGTLAALGDEELVLDRIVDEACDRHAVAFQPDGDAEMRDGMQKVGGAIERIDMPAMRLVGTLEDAAFLEHEAPAGA